MVSSGFSRPRIGLSTYVERARCLAWNTDFVLLQQSYVDAVVRAGGVPVLLPPQPDGAAEAVAGIAGLVLTGGADLEPALYGQAAAPQTMETRPSRDDWELRLFERARSNRLPILGICRGMQLLNVALGGSLTQHLPEAIGHHGHRPQPGTFGLTDVTLQPGSRLAALLGTNSTVHCHHHQAVDQVGTGLIATGHAEDRTIEALEAPGPEFLVGIQWHLEEDRDDIRLLSAFVGASRTPAEPTIQAGSPR